MGALTADERAGLLASSLSHDACIGWLSVLCDSAVADGRLGVTVARTSGTSPIAVQMSLQNKLIECASHLLPKSGHTPTDAAPTLRPNLHLAILHIRVQRPTLLTHTSSPLSHTLSQAALNVRLFTRRPKRAHASELRAAGAGPYGQPHPLDALCPRLDGPQLCVLVAPSQRLCSSYWLGLPMHHTRSNTSSL